MVLFWVSSLKLESKMVSGNWTLTSVWKIPVRKTALPFQTFRCSWKFANGKVESFLLTVNCPFRIRLHLPVRALVLPRPKEGISYYIASLVLHVYAMWLAERTFATFSTSQRLMKLWTKSYFLKSVVRFVTRVSCICFNLLLVYWQDFTAL